MRRHGLLALLACACWATAQGAALLKKLPEPGDDVKTLWLPVFNRDCFGTCEWAGLAAVTGGTADSAVCAVFIPLPPSYIPLSPEVYEGVKRLKPNVCQYVRGGATPAARASREDYYCACLPKGTVPGQEFRGVWTKPGSERCPSGYGLVPSVCKVEAEGRQFIGWEAESISSCVYFYSAKDTPKYRTEVTFSRLCAPDRFAYMDTGYDTLPLPPY